MAEHAVYVGCSGWNYDSWRAGVYPEGLGKTRWLERYSELFATVEVNSTFYRPASRSAVQRWVEQTPGGFIFAVKASQYLREALAQLPPGRHCFEFCHPSWFTDDVYSLLSDHEQAGGATTSRPS